jgi:hypothetical protein
VIDELREPPELKKYRQWVKTWKNDLKDDHRMLFVRQNAANLRDMLAEVGVGQRDQ